MTKVSIVEGIPPEILESIFNKLPTCTQSECQRVCKQWYLPSQRAFLKHVVLASCYEVEKFVTFFKTFGTPAVSASVRTIRIGSAYTPPDRARHLLEINAIEAMINYFPNVIEFVISGNCVNLSYFRKDHIFQTIMKNWPNLQVFRVDAGWLHPDECKIYLQTNYNLRSSIRQLVHYEHRYVTEELGGLKAYLSSFPNLQAIKVVSREFCKLESALPILEYSQGLKSLDLYVTREDEGCVFDRYIESICDNREESKAILEQKLMLLKNLKISMATFCTYTIEFLISHLTSLRQLHISVNQVNIKEWTMDQKKLLRHELMDYLCAREDSFSLRSLQVNYNQENEYMNDILHKLYHQLPHRANYSKVERHVHIKLHNNSPHIGADCNNMYGNVRNFGFEMKSAIERDSVLVRSAYFSHFILWEGGLRNKSLKYLHHMDGIQEDVYSLTFDAYGMHVLTNVIPNIFEDTMQQFVNVRKVSVHLSRNYPKKSSFVSQDTTSVHPQLTHLEIIAGNAQLIPEDMLPIASRAFPSLKYLSLWFNSGWYNEHEYKVDMEETDLERLHLDVTPIRVQIGNNLERPVELSEWFFILKVTTAGSITDDEKKKETKYYRVSLDYLSMTQITEDKTLSSESNITMHIIFKSVRFVNLYLYRKFSDQFRSVLSMDPKDLIQTTLTL